MRQQSKPPNRPTQARQNRRQNRKQTQTHQKWRQAQKQSPHQRRTLQLQLLRSRNTRKSGVRAAVSNKMAASNPANASNVIRKTAVASGRAS
jgi:3'-phosphoadenosine 5'-phosphosulfate (PAPS) 3'-phosphatase